MRHNGGVTQPTGPAGPYQMPTGTPAAVAGKAVSPAGYWIGAAILLLGCGGAIIWFAVVIVGLVNAPEDFDRVRVPGSTVLTLDDGDWMIYQEFPGANSGGYLMPPSIFVTGPSGRDISLRTVTTNYNYSIGSHDGVALYEFTAPTAGAYTIEATTVGEPTRAGSQTVAVGRPLFDVSDVGGILGSIALGAISFLVGLVILIVTIVRRGRARRRLQPAMAPYGGPPYGGPPYGGPPSYPPAPGGAPPPAPGWAQPTPPAPQAWPPAGPPPSAPPSPWTPPGEPGAAEPGGDDSSESGHKPTAF